MGMTPEQRRRLEELLGDLRDPAALAAVLEREEQEAREAEARAERARVAGIFAKDADSADEEAAAARERAEADAAAEDLRRLNERWRALEAIIGEAWPEGRAAEADTDAEVEVLAEALDELVEVRKRVGLRRTLGRVAARATGKGRRAMSKARHARIWLDGWAELLAASHHDGVADDAFARARRSRSNARATERSVMADLVRLAIAVARAVPPRDASADDLIAALQNLAADPLPDPHWDAAGEAVSARLRRLWRRELRQRAVALLGG